MKSNKIYHQKTALGENLHQINHEQFKNNISF